MIDETHYYPFGLVMAGISGKAALTLDNKSRYNGIEQNDAFDLNMYDAFYRNLDPQIGRFWQVDPKAIDEVSPFSAMLNNPVLMNDPLGDTTMYYDTNGTLLYTTYAKGATNAFIINDKFLNGFKKAFAILGENASLDAQGSFDSKILAMNESLSLGDAYDLNSISNFYTGNVNKYSIDKVAGTPVDNMSNITLDGKAVSRSFLKKLNGAEVSFRMIKKRGVWVVNDESVKTYRDLMEGPIGSSSEPSGHLHPFIKALEGKTLQYTYQAQYGPVTIKQGPFARSSVPSGEKGDVGQAKREGKIGGTIRNVVVNYSHIYLYDGRNIGVQIRKR